MGQRDRRLLIVPGQERQQDKDFFLSRDKGTTEQKILHCPGTKGQRDKLKILPRDGTVRDSQNPGWDGPGQPKNGTGRGTKRDRAEKDVLKQKKDALKQKRTF